MKKRHPAAMAKSTPRAPKKRKQPLETEYLGYFVPPPISRQDDNDNYSLEQPSHLKWVPSETTYGVGPLVVPALVDA
jgi:hypothetical protein